MDIQLTDAYPFEPPKMRFMTKVWHPNVSSANGAICLDILKEQWSPALSIKTAMLSLQALLSSPEPNDPQDAVVARQYMDNLAEFNARARRWTSDTPASAKAEARRLKEMGFANAARARSAARQGMDSRRSSCSSPALERSVTTTRGAGAAVRERRAGRTRRRGTPFFVKRKVFPRT